MVRLRTVTNGNGLDRPPMFQSGVQLGVSRDFHTSIHAAFTEVNGAEVVSDYGDWLAEHAALTTSAGVVDLSFRSRLCLMGADRAQFLHGQVTNDVNAIGSNSGCYAALVSNKGRMQSDLHIWRLADELLLDFEPGYGAAVTQRLEKFIVSDDVQVMDAAPHYGLVHIEGPTADAVIAQLQLFSELPAKELTSTHVNDPALGLMYLMNLSRAGSRGFDLFIPVGSLGEVAGKLITAAQSIGGRACGWRALETARIEAGIPRFGVDMDETNLPPETGIESRAMNYRKGCYIGQEVLNRLHTMGNVTRALRGLILEKELTALPVRGDKLAMEKEIGRVTSAVFSPRLNTNIALAYVRREQFAPGTELTLETKNGNSRALVAELPFVKAAV